MYIYTYKKSKRKKSILKSFGRIGSALFMVLSYVAFMHVGGTNAVFTDRAEINDMTFATGVWIPTLTMTIAPEVSDGVYQEPPCVKLYSDIDDVTVYYSFDTGTEIIGGTVDEDTCVFPPEGESTMMAYGVNDKNDNWISEKIYEDFNVHPVVISGAVVINELMWMGSFGNDSDEWIELRNMSDEEIDLSGWRIKGAGKGNGGHIQIPHGYVIKAHGYFLITAQKWNKTKVNLEKDLPKDEGYTHVASMGLKDSGEELILQDKEGNMIDTAWKDKRWSDGWNGKFFHMSMERDDDPGDGTHSSNWHTCIDRSCNDEIYWRKEAFNFGTPGAQNSPKSHIFDIDHDRFEENFIKKMKDHNNVFDDLWNKNFGEKVDCEKNECKKDDDKKNDKKVDDEVEEMREDLPEENDLDEKSEECIITEGIEICDGGVIDGSQEDDVDDPALENAVPSLESDDEMIEKNDDVVEEVKEENDTGIASENDDVDVLGENETTKDEIVSDAM